jgi:hypothetical protein
VRDRGVLVVTVPAHSWLWSALDDASGHKRRYTRRQLGAALVLAGLDVVTIQPFAIATVPALLLRRLALRSRGPSDGESCEAVIRRSLATPREPLNTVLAAALRAEAPLRALRFPVAGTLLAVAKVRR